MESLDFDRAEMQTVQELLRSETRPIPSVLLEKSMTDLGTADIPREVFFSREYHELEVEKLWKKVWQWACREEELSKVGDYIVYDIADLSAIVVRSNDHKIRAFYNSCLHRGTQLQVDNGNVKTFKCPFHGWRWNLDGSLAHIPCRWDFEHVNDQDFRLPELKVGTWQGFVFVNFDPNCEPLESYLENIPEHFKHFCLEERFTATRVAKVVPANWKVALEAFLEPYHVFASHPQVLPFTGDASAQCDIYGRHNRTITPVAVQSPHLGKRVDQQTLAKRISVYAGVDPATVHLSEGMTARSFAAEVTRQKMHERFNLDCSTFSDSQMLDSIRYLIFPNAVLAGDMGVSVNSRVRPNGNDPDTSIFENLILLPCLPDKRPSPAPTHWLQPDESWTNASGLGKQLGEIFDQDTLNMARVQRGLKASAKAGITLSRYLESRIRHFHQVLDRQLES